ncbi:SHIKIMATE KINASE 1 CHLOROPLASTIC-LIKE ISOFORM X1 [Salix koriyanagi]|uniref:shikimate kinase n=1 Tax=Salix koriyanagi TaxID=2511006 RepID=A0A9Q0ZGD9_9ROSI|nr:SHIKIMATE KINASE 1 CHLOROPLASTIC-LIKE ISOFORM X1 [Salix koriyanagi]
MEANFAQRMQISTAWIDTDKFPRKPTSFLRFSGRFKEHKRHQVFVSAQFRPVRDENRRRWASFQVSCSYNNSQVSTLESESLQDLLNEEALILKNKSQEIEPYLNGRCIYLVGMMGSGKTTVGKILSRTIHYSFCDCDKLVEQDVGVPSVAEIFEIYGEDFFRDKETEALEKLSIEHRFVVSTGGGAFFMYVAFESALLSILFIRMYMSKGISVWLDVPLEELAQRIAAVGTKSRPLLDNESGDAYTNAFRRLSTLFEKRHKAYKNAKARVSLENIAAKLGYKDVSNITPAMIAIEALEQIGNIL